MKNNVKVVIFGMGSIGIRHVKLLKKRNDLTLFAFRSKTTPKTNKFGLNEIYSWNELKKLHPDIALITNPTYLHIETARKCSELGCKLFIEKPIGIGKKDLDNLLNEVKKNNSVTYIAYNLRFHSVIIELKKYMKFNKPLHMRIVCSSFLPNWRKDQDYIKSYSRFAKKGGGVVLDLSHEIDYAEYLFGKVNKIAGVFGKRSKLTSDAEDYADILLTCDKGPVNIYVNYFGQIQERNIIIDYERISVKGDLINNSITEYKNYKRINQYYLTRGKDNSYEKQLEYFFDNLENTRMMNNIFEASDLFKQIILFKDKN
ncbi:MAG: Gfo/Idh/MocA family oxidoreductase [Bacteroidota bacterium]